MGSVSKYAEDISNEAYGHNYDNIKAALKGEGVDVLLDCGCGDGELTMECARDIGAKRVVGIEILEGMALKAADRGIEVHASDLNDRFPLDDCSIDAITLNQVIEHLYDTDNLIREIRRVLKRGGVALVSTENLASWHNFFSLLLGWQPFTLGPISDVMMGVGNPLSIHRDVSDLPRSMQHHRVFAYRGLIEVIEIHGLRVEVVLGAGYFPFRGKAAQFLSSLDVRHSAFITAKARKI